MKPDEVVAEIRRQFAKVLALPALQALLKEEAPKAGDIICLNNSFVFRDGKTRKNRFVLGANLENADPVTLSSPGVLEKRFNVELKVFPSKDPSTRLSDLEAAVAHEMKRIGPVLFVLLGEIDSRIHHEETIGHALFTRLLFQSTLAHKVSIQDKTIIVSDLADPEEVWTHLTREAKTAGLIQEAFPEGFQEAFGVALEKASANARASLTFPMGAAIPESNILRQIAKRIADSETSYKAAFAKCNGRPNKDSAAYTDVLRISYNFATEAMQLLRLVNEICDLKPLCLWLTLSEQWALSSALKDLPWTRLGKKPSLGTYEDLVKGARNAAFHHFLPFDRTVDVKVAGLNLPAESLTLFSDYTNRKSNKFTFTDQPIIDALLEFTRADEKHLSPAFWENNAEVIAATARLLEAFDKALRLLHRAVHTPAPPPAAPKSAKIGAR